MTDEKCKTMKELGVGFKELNKLDHIRDCMNDVLFEEGSSKDMLRPIRCYNERHFRNWF